MISRRLTSSRPTDFPGRFLGTSVRPHQLHLQKRAIVGISPQARSRKMVTHLLDLSIPAEDAAFGLMADFDADPHPNKVSLIAGAYREENGKPWVLPSVRMAKEQLRDENHEYLGIAGSPTFINLAKDLIFGPVVSGIQDNIGSIQTVSGTSANHIAATFLADRLRPNRVFIPSPTWINHKSIWEATGVTVAEYPYYSSSTKQVDMAGIIDTLDQAEPNDVVVLQACAHNPTGVDLTKSQWRQIADLCHERSLFIVFDSAYQGFATGDVDGDAWAVRHFTENVLALENHPGLCVAQSFSKNFGLYGERVGALHLVLPRNVSAQGARGEFMTIARREYSNPPRFGASIVQKILGERGLRVQWKHDLNTMSLRIQSTRCELRRGLEKKTQQDWSHVETQIGMFSYTGLTKEQVSRLRDEFHIYLLPSGRISVCGLNEGNLQYVIHAIGEVIKI